MFLKKSLLKEMFLMLLYLFLLQITIEYTLYSLPHTLLEVVQF
jgi:hypothetical protein